MSADGTNGKATINLVVAIITAVVATLGVIIAIATPLILMYSKINTMEVQVSERLQEIETQFKAADDFRNINLAQQARMNAIIWKQTFGTDYPAEVYYPAIARPR